MNSVTPIQQGESVLRPRARLIKTIGEELISDDVVAVIELVKNSYDANSPIVVIEFNGKVEYVKEGRSEKKILKKGQTSVTVYDEGTGMDLETVLKAWLEPATTFKKNSKNSNPQRRFTGEKGIGRFASAKLASELRMITRRKDDNEITVDFNWSDFSDDSKYLDSVKTKWKVEIPHYIRNNGTYLFLNNTLSDWDEVKLRELRVALSRLLSPVTPSEDFLIELKLPEGLENLSGMIERPETLNRPDYMIKGHISQNGVPDLSYSGKSDKQLKKLEIASEEFRLRPERESLVGPFDFEFRVWDRDTESLKQLSREIDSSVKNIKKDLDDLAGISIYRDNVRVLPYGNKNDDWLRLDIRRVNNPTKNLSNNQIVGYISLSLDKNPDLKDQSNREGIVQSQAFEDLKEYIKLILNQLEIKRYAERPRESDKPAFQESLFQRFSLHTITQYVQEKMPENKEFLDFVKKKDAEIQEGVKKVQDVISRYRRLTTLGLLIDAILHDGGNYLSKIDIQAHMIEKELKKQSADIDTVRQSTSNIIGLRKDFARLFKRIEPFGGRKRGRPQRIIVEKVIEDQFMLAHTDIERLSIACSLPQTENEVTIDEAELGIIIMNLLQNSVYWLETITSVRKIDVSVERGIDSLSIIFSDSGPGVKEELADLIFDPYFSTKPDGIGLGLTIVGELVSEYNGEFCLIHGPLDGATFRVTFKYRV